MSKHNTKLSFLFTTLLIFFATSCSNFLKGEKILKDIEESIEEASAPLVNVSLSVEKPEYGTTVPLELREIKVKKEYEIEFKPTSRVKFKEWVVTCSDPTADVSKLVYIENPKELVTKVKILSDKKGITITPKVNLYLDVVSITPQFSYSGAPYDSDIVITFNQPIDPESFYVKKLITKEDPSEKYIEYTNKYSFQDMQNGQEYQLLNSNNARYYLEPIINGNTVTIPSSKDLGTSTLINRQIVITLSKYITVAKDIMPKDVTPEDIESKNIPSEDKWYALAGLYENDYKYETKFSSEKEKIKPELNGLRIYTNNKDINLNELKTSDLTVWERNIKVNYTTNNYYELYYNGGNPFESDNLKNNLLMFDINQDDTFPKFVIDKKVDDRVPWSITVYSYKIDNELPHLSLYNIEMDEPDIEEFDNDRRVLRKLKKVYSEADFQPSPTEYDTGTGNNGSTPLFFKPDKNAFANLFDEDGIYDLIFTLQDSYGNVSEKYYECFVLYKNDFTDIIQNSNLVYDGENLDYKEDDYILEKVSEAAMSKDPWDNVSEFILTTCKKKKNNPNEKKDTVINGDGDSVDKVTTQNYYPVEIKLDNNKIIVNNNFKEYSKNINDLIPDNIPNVTLTLKNTEKNQLTILLDKSVINSNNNWAEVFPNCEIMFSTTKGETKKLYSDSVIVPIPENPETLINIYPVAVYSNGDKKAYFYGKECLKYKYEVSDSLAKPEINNENYSLGKGDPENDNQITSNINYLSLTVSNYKDFEEDVVFYYILTTENEISENASFMPITTISDSGVFTIQVPSGKIFYVFIGAKKGSSFKCSDGIYCKTNTEELDTVPPVVDNFDYSDLSYDVLGQMKIPVSDNIGLFVDENDVSSPIKYKWNDTVDLLGKMTKYGDEKKGYLHIKRLFPSSKAGLSVTFRDKQQNSDTIELNFNKALELFGSVSIDKNNLICAPYWYEYPDPNNQLDKILKFYGLKYSIVNDDGQIDLANEYDDLYVNSDGKASVPTLNEKFICINIKKSVNIEEECKTSVPCFVYSGNNTCQLRHLYSDENGTSLFISGGKALILIYALPKSEIPANDPNNAYTEKQYQNSCNDAIIQNGVLIDSKIYDNSTSIVVDNSTGVPDGWAYVIKAVFSDNTTQNTDYNIFKKVLY